MELLPIPFIVLGLGIVGAVVGIILAEAFNWYNTK